MNIKNNDMFQGMTRLLSMGMLAIVSASCTGNYLEINTNPYEVSKEQMATDGYDVGAAINALCGTVVSTDVNTAQFTDCLLGGPMGGYYSTTGSWTEGIFDNFNAPDNWTSVFMTSSFIVPSLFTNLAELETITDDPVILAIAKVIKVTAMHRVTDTYGPIPYSQIEVGTKLNVPYDSQKTVYETMFRDLDEAIAVLTENRNVAVSANADPIYGGNVEKWCRFANSMKLRLAMRTIYVQDFNAKDRIMEAVNHPVGMFVSNDDNARLRSISFGEKGNPLYASVKYNEISGSSTGGDTHAAAEITSYMNACSDPRRAAYFIPSEFDAEYLYTGMLISVEKPALSTVGRKYSGVKLSPSDPVMWMNAAEVAFLKAEAEAVFGLDIPGGSAEDFYNEGIRLSFEQWGVSGEYAGYIAKEDKVKVAYADPEDNNNNRDIVTEFSVKWDDSAPEDEKQERIIIQKWIANYHLGNEAWADQRRTGYPKFFSVGEGGNGSNGVVTNELGPRRMPYPQDEFKNNAVNVTHAVSELLGGPNSMATRLWWDCKEDSKRCY